MAREYEEYRPYIELIQGMFPGRLELGVADVAAMIDRTPRTVHRRYGDLFFHGTIGIVQLARAMCEGEKKKKQGRRRA